MTVIPGVLSFIYVENTGVSFGLAAGFGPALLAACPCCGDWLRGLSVACAPCSRALRLWGLGMLAGGALGNAIDRVAFGFVTDFIATDFIDFPVFNVADIGVTVGGGARAYRLCPVLSGKCRCRAARRGGSLRALRRA